MMLISKLTKGLRGEERARERKEKKLPRPLVLL